MWWASDPTRWNQLQWNIQTCLGWHTSFWWWPREMRIATENLLVCPNFCVRHQGYQIRIVALCFAGNIFWDHTLEIAIAGISLKESQFGKHWEGSRCPHELYPAKTHQPDRHLRLCKRFAEIRWTHFLALFSWISWLESDSYPLETKAQPTPCDPSNTAETKGWIL